MQDNVITPAANRMSSLHKLLDGADNVGLKHQQRRNSKNRQDDEEEERETEQEKRKE